MESAETLDNFYSKYRTINSDDLAYVHYGPVVNKLAECSCQQIGFINQSMEFLLETPLKWWNGLAGDERDRFLQLLEV